MALVKIPPENHALFHAAVPKDPRVETLAMSGGVAAKVTGNIFAGLFGRSTLIWLPEDERAEALALEGAKTAAKKKAKPKPKAPPKKPKKAAQRTHA